MYDLIVERDDAVEALNRIRNGKIDGVTVCIPYFNEPAEVIYKALESVQNQTVPPAEVFVIDDGSTKPLEVSEGWRNLKVIRVTNRGLPSARNTALMLTRTLGFLPLDADDWIEPTYIEKTLPLLDDADVVLTGLQEHGPTRNGTYMPGFDRPYDQVTEDVLWQYNRFFYCSLFRTSILQSIGGYHPKMAGWPGVNGGFEDWDVWIDLKRRNARFTAINEVLFHYTTKRDSMLTRAEKSREFLVGEMHRHHAR